MFDRTCLRTLLCLAAVLPFAGCNSSQVDSISVTATSATLAAGSTEQFTALAVVGHSGHPSQNVTSSVAWTSSSTNVATISASGMVTAVAAGTTTITASEEGFGGLISGTASLTVTGGGTVGTTALTSISIIPGAQAVSSPSQTTQFIAIGTTSTGSTQNITNQVSWNSSSTQIATISGTGLATGVSQGTATFTAIATNPDMTIVTGTATFTVTNGTAEQITSLTIYPGSQAATSQDQTSQFFVLGTEGTSGLQFDDTAEVVWSSSNTAVATIGTSGSGTPGLATAVGVGSTSITATFTNSDGSKVVGTASYSVTIGAAAEPLLSINIVPGAVTVSNKGMTAQYLAFGTYSTTPTVRDLTNQVTWISTLPEVASINSGGTTGEAGGLATAQGYTGQSNIYAEATNPDGTVVLSNPQTFSCNDPATNTCNQAIAHPQFATITVFNAGENTTTWLVTAPSDTGTPNLIHCGPGSKTGGSVCTGTYETGSTVVLTESPTGSGFGGWSSGDGVAGVGCTPGTGYTLLNSPTCTVTLNGDTSVGAIFY